MVKLSDYIYHPYGGVRWAREVVAPAFAPPSPFMILCFFNITSYWFVGAHMAVHPTDDPSGRAAVSR